MHSHERRLERAPVSATVSAARTVLLAILLGTAAPFPAGAQNPADSLIVGVLRTDGIVVPYAVYAEEGWSRIDHDSIPLSIIRRDEPWVHVAADGTTMLLQPGSLIRFTSGDSWYESWGQVTDYCPRTIPFGYPVDRFGAVLSEGREIHPMVRHDSDSVPVAVAALIRERFEALEGEEVRRLSGDTLTGLLQFGTPIAADRRQGEVEVEVLFSGGPIDSGGRLHYFAATRRYPSVPHPDPRYVPYRPFTRLNGWILARDGKLALIEHDLFVTCCAGMEVTRYQPFALLLLEGRTFVMAELGGWEGSLRTIFELDGSRLVKVLEDQF